MHSMQPLQRSSKIETFANSHYLPFKRDIIQRQIHRICALNYISLTDHYIPFTVRINILHVKTSFANAESGKNAVYYALCGRFSGDFGQCG